MKGPQVFVGRADKLRGVPYDENIRMVDHRDSSAPLQGGWCFVQDPGFVVFQRARRSTRSTRPTATT